MADPIVMFERKRIALVAHNNMKTSLIDCLRQHRAVLSQHELFGTGTTGSLVEKELHLPVTKFQSGPMGGDQQLGATIASQELDIVCFLIDPLDSHPHNAGVQALQRLAQVWNVVCATTTTTIDFIFTSPKMNESNTRYVRSAPAISTVVKHEQRALPYLQTRRVAMIGEKPKLRFSHLSPVRARLSPQQIVFKKC